MSDLISRQAAIDAINQLCQNQCPYTERIREIGACCGACFVDDCTQIILGLPSAQPDMPEKSVWFRIGETLVDVSKSHITAEEGIVKIRGYLQRMQKPERKRGRWIEYIPEHGKCPFCGNQVDLLNGKANNFCGECGADIREGKE